MKNNRSGAVGVIGLIGCIALYFVLRRFIPFLSTLLVIVGVGILALIILLVVLVIVFSKTDIGKNKNGNNSERANDAQVRAHLVEIRTLTARIRNEEIRKAGNRISKSVDSILRTLKEKPRDTSSVRRFRNYYLPTIRKILAKYLTIEESGISVDSTAEATLSCLHEVEGALLKFHESLYDGEKMDLSVEMKVLNMMCRQDGLLTEEDLPDSSDCGDEESVMSAETE